MQSAEHHISGIVKISIDHTILLLEKWKAINVARLWCYLREKSRTALLSIPNFDHYEKRYKSRLNIHNYTDEKTDSTQRWKIQRVFPCWLWIPPLDPDPSNRYAPQSWGITCIGHLWHIPLTQQINAYLQSIKTWQFYFYKQKLGTMAEKATELVHTAMAKEIRNIEIKKVLTLQCGLENLTFSIRQLPTRQISFIGRDIICLH